MIDLLGKKVKIVKNFGNVCEPFVGLTGVLTTPFSYGCCKKDWYGVVLDDDTIYGRKLNFHIEEIIFLDEQ